MKRDDDDFRERIHRALPVTHRAFFALLGLLDIRASTEIPTASVSLGLRSILRINPDFIDRHCPTDTHLMMLVLHELMHVLLGHTRLYPRMTPSRNVAFDAVINADLCRSFPRPEYTALFRNFYDPGTLPEALLRPPPRWPGPDVDWRLGGRAGEVHRALYLDGGVTTGELLELVEETVASSPGPNSPDSADALDDLVGRLLGDHGNLSGIDDEDGLSPDLLRTLRDIVARWPREALRRGRDDGGNLEERTIDVTRRRRPLVACIRRALLSVASSGPSETGARVPVLAPRPAALPVRSPRDRRGAVLEALGRPPLLWHDRLIDRSWNPVARTVLYVDVSGSMTEMLEPVYAALAPLTDLLDPVVRLFSTEIHDVPLKALRSGVVRTTGGTAISCVTADLVQRRVRRALIITDGQVGIVPDDHRRRLRRLRAAVVVTANGDPSFADALRARVHHLPEPR